MDDLYYSRISMSGWVFLAITILTLWEDGGEAWSQLISILDQDHSVATVAVFGAIVGISGPPAFGFLIEKIAYFFVFAMRKGEGAFPGTEEVKELMLKALPSENHLARDLPADGLFHVLFYCHADQRLVTWARRRRGQVFACVSSAFAILLALVINAAFFHAFSWLSFIVGVVLIAVLAVSARRNHTIHNRTISAWGHTQGRKMARDYGEMSGA